MFCDVAGNQRGPDFLGFEAVDLLVQCTDSRSLGVIQHRAIDRTRDMVFCELRRTAHVHDCVEFIQLRCNFSEWEQGGILHLRIISTTVSVWARQYRA